ELLDSENTQELNNTENELINYELNDYIKNNDLKDNNELITEDNNNLITEEEEQWNILIDEWSAISEQENINEEQESSELNEITHPADNRNAK
ncbi:19512_t:CDS:1, partial [Racocetra fulgida]